MIRKPTLLLSFILLLSLALVLATTLVMAQAVGAGTITVDSASDDGSGCTLREAIEAANTDSAVGNCATGDGPDTIVFNLPADSTITLNGSQLPLINDTLTIDGSTAGNLTISGDNASGIFQIGNDTAVTITQLTITAGSESNGAGIYNEGMLTVRHSTLAENAAVDGGGIYNAGGSLTVTDSTLSNNSATFNGGGIYNMSGSVTVHNSTLRNNSATMGGSATLSNSTSGKNSPTFGGGGIWNDSGGVMTVTNSIVSDNSTDDRGGGIHNKGTMTISHNTISGNSAPGIDYYGLGGGIYNSETGILTVSDSTLSDNSALAGGGILNYSPGTLTVASSTFNGNVGDHGGGGIGNFGPLTVVNSTFSGNSTDIIGGGIVNAGPLTVTHSTFSDNSTGEAGGGGGIYNGESGVVTLINSIVANSLSPEDCRNEGTFSTFSGNLVESGNCGGDALTDDPRLGPLQNNGGSTFTHALLPGSPAWDAAVDGECAATDQRGVSRPQGDGCDIGAYEFQALIYLPLLQVHGAGAGTAEGSAP